MSSFFTTPASQRKRKRTEAPSAVSKKRNVTSAASQSAKAPRRKEREESISGSESSDEERGDVFSEEHESSGSSDDEGETAAEKRLRLAERYLDSIRVEVEDDGGFDAADIDRDLISERLKEDVAETKGKIYRKIAADLDLQKASHIFGKSGLQRSITGCAVRLPYAWTISKDLVIEKWELADPKTYNVEDSSRPTNITPRRTPKRLFWRKGNKNKTKDRDYMGHTSPIISIAVSDSGKFLATGDETARLIIWDADTLTPRRMFTQHRDSITSLAFRRGTEQLYSASADRSVKIWSASELAYIDTLLGHQDSLVGIAGGLDGTQETCISVGGRDRTAILWKVVEETMLKFNGGGTAKQKGMEKLRKGRFGDKSRTNGDVVDNKDPGDADDDTPIAYAEGSMDCVALLDAGLFVTGSDNGGLSLWSINRKKPVFTVPLTHGRDPPLPPEKMSANNDAKENGTKGPRLARYITAIATVPFADLILTASWDGWIRAWRIGPEKRTIEELGEVGRVPLDEAQEELDHGNGANDAQKGVQDGIVIRGIVNGLAVCERGDRGKDGLCIVAAVGKEPRLGNWMKAQGRNGIYVFEVPRKIIVKDKDEGDDAGGEE
ncbi:WD40 repeat-like protein [Melanomma pulvis-pyrius CBS 109.77]|uniref:WD40 repeat-like protein n=1 Tax=Melanomma pulvis-pyrius CBS 109.77 TaxID=1314802 RepID=A0A6A6WSN0_9PLEO|nr:WD40 repeat-like protein [Melanomma pulvis-pyrius CBS 109.77]